MANKFPRKFLQALQEQGNQVLLDWLRANKAPEPVIELLDGLTCLDAYLGDPAYETREYPDLAAQGLNESVMDVAACIDALGGDFRK